MCFTFAAKIVRNIYVLSNLFVRLMHVSCFNVRACEHMKRSMTSLKYERIPMMFGYDIAFPLNLLFIYY